MLLTKTLTSSTFKLALIAIGTFGVIVSAIFSYVYLSTSAYVRSRSDRAIMAEYRDLRGVYEQSGREALIGRVGRAKTALDPNGMVWVESALWEATAEGGPVAAGARVEVVAMDGLHLLVRPAPEVTSPPVLSSGAFRSRA